MITLQTVSRNIFDMKKYEFGNDFLDGLHIPNNTFCERFWNHVLLQP